MRSGNIAGAKAIFNEGITISGGRKFIVNANVAIIS
jgi:hypothetical protein